jgi:hypothetical protein
MALYKLTKQAITVIPETKWSAVGWTERYDIQRILRNHPEVIDPGLMTIAEEFDDWSGSRRRIDLLALHNDGTLVVVELKREDSESMMELQAIRYAAMAANMTFDQLVKAHAQYLISRTVGGVAADRIRAHLNHASDSIPEIKSARPRIIVVSADFSTELTTSVLWLNGFDLGITCLQMRPHLAPGLPADELLVDVTRIIPLPQAASFTVGVNEKAAETNAASRSRSERSWVVLERLGRWRPGVELRYDPRRVPADREPADVLFCAHVDAGGKVIWAADGQSYSLSRLTGRLRDDHSLPGLSQDFNAFAYWTFADDPSRSLWDAAQGGS